MRSHGNRSLPLVTLGAAAVLLVAAEARAQFNVQWVGFTNESNRRIYATPGLGLSDPEEKDYAWGDVDNDGDLDLAVVRKQPGTTSGKKPNVLFMNEDGALVDRTVARFGRLDVAVNNAGTEGQPGPVTEQTAESYAATFDTNVLGTVLSMKHELRVMQAQGHGAVINLSSTMGQRTAPGASIIKSAADAVFGNAITSRMLSVPANTISRRSIPGAMPPWGGVPYSSASRKNPNRSRASSVVIPNALTTKRCTSRL